MSATPAQAATACPYCRAPFEAEEELTVCEACATPHHADCYAENGGCTVFGCSRAPVDEPKISVTTTEVTAQYRPVAASLPASRSHASTPPPPRRPGSTTAVPPPPGRGMRPVVFEDTTRYLTPPRDLTFGGYNETAPAEIPRYIRRRSRVNFVLLGVFLGSFGAHNFYAGYMKRAAVQVLLTVFVLFAGGAFWGGLVSWLWALVEVFVVKNDDDGVAFI